MRTIHQQRQNPDNQMLDRGQGHTLFIDLSVIHQFHLNISLTNSHLQWLLDLNIAQGIQ